VVTILLLLLALNLLPKHPPRLSSYPLRLRDGVIGIAAGAGAGLLSWAVMTRQPNDPISAYHWANSYSGGGGTNVVNVTLVDFRAFDTFGEIIVLRCCSPRCGARPAGVCWPGFPISSVRRSGIR
jgi:multicomponent K+:H+ antiporter subunit A